MKYVWVMARNHTFNNMLFI